MKLKGCTGNALRNGTDFMTGNSLHQLNARVQSLAAPGSPFELERREHTTMGLHGGQRGVRSLQDRLTHLDLFSGIGGFALAARWAGFKTIGFCEREPFAQRVLKKHWPQVPIHDDVCKLDGTKYLGTTLLTGGFPCQPFSVAGKQNGKGDDRYLWPQMLRVVAEARPTWIVGENVLGLIGLALDQVLSDLGAAGYSARTFVIPACGVDARHRRDRVWIVAHSNSVGGNQHGAPSDLHGALSTDSEQQRGGRASEDWGHRGWAPEPGVPRVDDGIPDGVDRVRALGNAIVPEVVFPLLDAIGAIELGADIADARGGSAWERVSGKAELSRAQMENASDQ